MSRPGRIRLVTLLAARLLLLLAAFAVPLLVLEAGFRLFGPFLPGEYNLGIEREYDPVLGWRHRAGYVGGTRTAEYAVLFTINEQGLRDEPIPYEKPAGGFRVLALGDSFLAATHVSFDQMMTKQLQGILRAQLPGRPVDVVNAGVSGYGQAQEYIYFNQEGYRYSPDLVLVVVFLGNDLIDNIRASDGKYDRPAFEVDGEDKLVQVEWPGRDPNRRPTWDDLLVRNSLVYNFLQSGVLRKFDASASQPGENGRDAGQDLQIYERRMPAKLRRSWEVTEELLATLADRAAAGGARTLVVGAPSFRQLDPASFLDQLAAESLDPSRYDVEQPSRLLREATERRNLPYLDLLPILRQAAERGEGQMFYPKNTHWAPDGQWVVARAIAEKLASDGLDAEPIPLR
jgi:lysophospholipase L1-like esterase